MNVDFRSHIDPWCKYNPQSLAADSADIIRPKHKRFDRVFLPYQQDLSDHLVRQARTHLRRTCRRYLCIDIGDTPADYNQEAENDNLLHNCPQDPTCRLFLQTFLDGDYPAPYKQALANFFLLLSSDTSVTTVLPPIYHSTVLAATASLQLRNVCEETFTSFCPELDDVISEAVNAQAQGPVAQFLSFLLDFIGDIHRYNYTVPVSVELPNTYNPEAGVAYYFTPSGNQVRHIPICEVNTLNNNFDEAPYGKAQCKKQYGKVSLGGWTYLFLWFCPVHGHCYGFHIIDGAEGRKDPCFSLFRYMQAATKEVFYDFACSLSEYCLNRIPAFIHHTRFWHDVFHGVTHVCGDNFKSRRLDHFVGINTEICEQFNSFIQCIKYTGTHLSQSHFCFFMQFMIYVWNNRKTKVFTKKLDLVLAGNE